MPILPAFFSSSAKPFRFSCLPAAPLLAALLFSTILPAQTLARPGWAGSGMTSNSWWKHSLLYSADPRQIQQLSGKTTTNLKALTANLDDLGTLGADGLLLTNLAATSSTMDQTAARYLDPTLGTLDDFDDLLRQASSHDLRILIALPASLSDADLTSTARFWLNRGVAGIRLLPDSPSASPSSTPDGSTQAAKIQQLRILTNSYVGERVIIGQATSDPAAAPHSTRAHSTDTPQLVVFPLSFAINTTSAAMRASLQKSEAMAQDKGPQPLLEAEPSPGPDLSRVAATVLLGGRSAAFLPPLPPASQTQRVATSAHAIAPVSAAEAPTLMDWYRRMSVLHQSSPALRQGTAILLDHDDQNSLVWVRKPQVVSAISPPLVFVCNLSDKTIHLNLKPDMVKLHLRGSFLRTVLRSDNAMGPMNLESVTLQPFGVYIGELRY